MNMMEIDDEKTPTPTTQLQLHPLVIFAISDHYTRTRLGGSPLPTNAPVIGLLFGSYTHTTSSPEHSQIHTNNDWKVVHVMDAEDIAISQDVDMIHIKMELHRAVYPNQRVIGWYKVVHANDEDDWMEEDVAWHRLMVQLCAVDMAKDSPIVLIMRQNENEHSNSISADVENKEEEEEELPLSMYQLQEERNGNGVVFVDIKFELNSRETERISMEHLFKAQETKKTIGVLEQMESSIDQLNSRITVLLQYLKSVQKYKLPPNHYLLRRINGLLYQISAANQCLDDDVLEESSNRYIDSSIICQLASLTKIIQSMQGFTEKVSLVTNLNSAQGTSAVTSTNTSRERELFMMRSRGSGWS